MNKEQEKFKPLELIKVEPKDALQQYIEKTGALIAKYDMEELEKEYAKQPGKRCSDELAILLNLLRAAQKDFFKSKPGTLLRATALEQSKALEKELDKFLEERAQPKKQPELF
jgi:hypothetical protein